MDYMVINHNHDVTHGPTLVKTVSDELTEAQHPLNSVVRPVLTVAIGVLGIILFISVAHGIWNRVADGLGFEHVHTPAHVSSPVVTASPRTNESVPALVK